MSAADPPAASTLQLEARIAAAFSARARPQADALVEAAPADPESDALAAAFGDLSWQDVGVAMVRDFKDGLPLFAPAAFAYYLPAYLLACLRDPAEVDSALDAVFFNLTPPRVRRGWAWRFFQDRASLFTAPESEAIEAFLAFEQERERADWAAAGRTPPPERVGSALNYWAKANAGRAGGAP